MYRWIQFFQSKISQVCLDLHANFDFKILGNHSVDLNTSSEFVCFSYRGKELNSSSLLVHNMILYCFYVVFIYLFFPLHLKFHSHS